jgi:hypothetical protein
MSDTRGHGSTDTGRMSRPSGRLHRPPWLRTLCDALEDAEQAVARYYAISPREWATRFRYDTGSAADHPDLSFHPGALAQIVQLEKAARPEASRYRIVLKDEEVLALGHELGTPAVLRVVLAHELVHLVRFASKRVPFELPRHQIETEEREVRRITREALRPSMAGSKAAVLTRLTQPPAG